MNEAQPASYCAARFPDCRRLGPFDPKVSRSRMLACSADSALPFQDVRFRFAVLFHNSDTKGESWGKPRESQVRDPKDQYILETRKLQKRKAMYACALLKVAAENPKLVSAVLAK